MKFNTCSIHKENQKGKAQIQVTFDEDYNLPDYKPDISSLILKKGNVSVDEVKVTRGHVSVKGNLKFEVLYRAEQNSLGFCSVTGSASFQENVALDQAEEFDTATVCCTLEDLSIHITNSRKLAIRGLIQMDVTISEFVTVEVPCDCDGEQKMEVQKQSMTYLHLKASGRDQCRVHEELELPPNKLNVQDVIWKDLRLESVVCTPMSGSVQIRGDLSVFCIYQGEPGIRLEWFETKIPVVCRIDVAEAEPDSICHAKVTDMEWNLQVQEDLEGENRVLAIDGIVKGEYRVYEERKTDIIRDLYALDKTLLPETEQLVLEQLLMKNDSRCKVNDTLSLEQGQKEILQICNCSGEIQVDRQTVVEDGLLVEGAVHVQVLYLTQDDAVPVDAAEGLVPFQYRIEAPGITPQCRYELNKDMNLLSVMMKNSSTLEIQALLDFHIIVFSRDVLENIVDVKEQPLKLDDLLSFPGLTGIRVKPGDTLWSIAKANHTTQEVIRQNNPKLEEPLKTGTVLLILKQID